MFDVFNVIIVRIKRKEGLLGNFSWDFPPLLLYFTIKSIDFMEISPTTRNN